MSHIRVVVRVEHYDDYKEIGTVLSLNISAKKGTVKQPVMSVVLEEDFGIVGDAHAGKHHRQVSLLSRSSIDKMNSEMLHITPGMFAENITTSAFDLHTLPLTSKIVIADVVLEVSQIGKQCHKGCEIRTIVGDCVMPREGIFTKVLKGGKVTIDDKIRIMR